MSQIMPGTVIEKKPRHDILSQVDKMTDDEVLKLLQQYSKDIVWTPETLRMFSREQTREIVRKYLTDILNEDTQNTDKPKENGNTLGNSADELENAKVRAIYDDIWGPKKTPSIFKGRQKLDKGRWYLPLAEKSNVEEWSNYFSTPRTTEEIREKILTDYDNVCFSYMCIQQTLDEKFIPELMALSTGLLNKDNYDYCLQPVMRATHIMAGIEDGEINLQEIPYDPKAKLSTDRKLTRLIDRLDWKSISLYQDLSASFREKYFDLLEGNCLEIKAQLKAYKKKHMQGKKRKA